MHDYMKTALVGAWAVGFGALAFSLDLSSIGSWTLLVGLGLLPSLVLFRTWNYPAQTTSQSIREVLK